MNGTRTLAELGLTARHVSYWCAKGYLRPVDPTPGSGRWLEFSDREVDIARAMLAMVNAGVPVSVAARMARNPADGAAQLLRLANMLANLVTDTAVPV